MPEPDPDTERLYVAHLRDGLVIAQSQMARLLTVNSVISVALMALALGIVSAGHKVEISGISLEIPVSTLILGTTGVNAVLYVVFVGLMRYADCLETALWDRYGGLGIQRPDNERMNPFASSSALEAASAGLVAPRARSKLAQVIDVLTSACVLASVTLLPIAAQVSGVIVVADAYASPWAWLILVIPLLSFLSLLGWFLDVEVERVRPLDGQGRADDAADDE
jgi:hypothetical protein